MANANYINMALLKVGVSQVLSASQNTPQALIVAAVYDHVLNLVLRAHYWSFAMVWTKDLAQYTETVPGYAYAYALPTGLISVMDVRTSLKSPQVEYSIVGKKLCTNVKSPLLRYIATPTDDDFPADFVAAFTTRLAAEVAPQVAQKASRAQELMQLYFTELSIAQLADAAQDNGTSPEDETYSNLLSMRMGG